MDEVRRGQIALLILKYEACRDGVMFGSKTKSRIAESAKEFGISAEEAITFFETIVIDLVKMTFGLESIQLEHPTKEARMGEIALMIARKKMLRRGIQLDSKMKRNAGNIAKEIGISIEEVIEFDKALAFEIINEM